MKTKIISKQIITHNFMEKIMKLTMTRNIMFMSLAVILLSTSFVTASQDMYWHDKAFNRDWHLTPQSDEVSIKFNNDVSVADINTFADDYDLSVVHEAAWNNFAVFSLQSEFDIDAIQRFKADDRVWEVAVPGMDYEGFIKYYDPTEATVQFYQDLTEKTCLQIIDEIGAEVVKEQWTQNYYTISTAKGKNVFETISELNQYSEVWFSEPSIYGFDDALWTPDDPNFEDQWHLLNTGQESGACVCTPYGDHDVNAVQAWDMTRSDRGIVIVVIDTGMDLTHPDLQGNLLDRDGDDWDFADPDNSPDDEGNHGTACSGLAAAVANNNEGVAG
ncbi:MAG: S8 family serine peptidase, partial [candidate division Zixibacteria bacterium]|nr:S8 family serine peptidase [candidate division Zixibacteria bacterium]